jgi:hypothetical protein
VAAATAISAAGRVPFIADMPVWTPNSRTPVCLANGSPPQEIKVSRHPPEDHDADQEQTPDRGGEVLTGPQQIQARGQ